MTGECSVIKVVTGSLFIPEVRNDKKYVIYEVIRPNDIAVPTHYFKIIKGGNYTEVYIMPNQKIEANTSLEKFKTTVGKIEKLSGVVFGNPESF